MITKGNLRLTPIIPIKQFVEVKVVDEAFVVEVGEECECKVGDKVKTTKIPLSKYKSEGSDSGLVVEEARFVVGIINQ